MKNIFNTGFNKGINFYLIGSLIFYFSAMKTKKKTLAHQLLLLSIFVILSLFIVYFVQ